MLDYLRGTFAQTALWVLSPASKDQVLWTHSCCSFHGMEEFGLLEYILEEYQWYQWESI